MATALSKTYGTPDSIITGGPRNPTRTPGQYSNMPRMTEDDYVMRSRGFRLPWYMAPGSEPFNRNMSLLADYQRILRQEERKATRAEEMDLSREPGKTSALGPANGMGAGTSTTTGGENTKTGERGSIAMPKRLEPRHRRLLQRIRRMSKRSLPPAPPAPLAPYEYQGAQGYTPTGAQTAVTQSTGIQGTILG